MLFTNEQLDEIPNTPNPINHENTIVYQFIYIYQLIQLRKVRKLMFLSQVTVHKCHLIREHIDVHYITSKIQYQILMQQNTLQKSYQILSVRFIFTAPSKSHENQLN